MSGAEGVGRAQPDPYAVFRPRRGRRVALTTAVLSLLIFSAGALSLPTADRVADGGVLDQLLLVLCGVVISALLWRFASIRAVPSMDGLEVRNLLTTRTLEWTQIVRVLFGGGAPWVSVDLDDTDTVAVMAIQKADGAFGQAEAARLTALVEVHSRPGTTR
jgi:hypothetical protein